MRLASRSRERRLSSDRGVTDGLSYNHTNDTNFTNLFLAY